jgi:hypothetical protein
MGTMCTWCQEVELNWRQKRYCSDDCRIQFHNQQSQYRRLRDRIRNGRKYELRSRVIQVGKRLPVYSYPEGVERPKTRGDCARVPRPCPFVSCRHHLYIDITNVGMPRLNFPKLEPHEMVESCSLDVADRGETKVEDVAALLNITREWVRQVEKMAFEKFQVLKG